MFPHGPSSSTYASIPDDSESEAPLQEQDEETSPFDSWSPPTPSSIPINPQSSQTVQQPAGHVGDAPSVALEGLRKVTHPSPSMTLPGGRNLLQEIDQCDQFTTVRAFESDVHYPFASRTEWQLAKWLGTVPLSQTDVDNFLHLDYVRCYSA